MSDTNSPVSLVTGGSGGIGAAVARRLLAVGHRVAVTGRDQGRLDRLRKELDAENLLPIVADATDHDATRAAVEATTAEFGRLDHAVANAGFSVHGDLLDADPERMRDMVLTNVLGPALLVRAALPALKETRGRIVLVGSAASFGHSPGNLYSATKWAVMALAENIRLMVTAADVGVTLVAPGKVQTAFWNERPGGRPEGRMLTAEQVADSVAWAIAQPAGVDVNTVLVRPLGQGSDHTRPAPRT